MIYFIIKWFIGFEKLKLFSEAIVFLNHCPRPFHSHWLSATDMFYWFRYFIWNAFFQTWKVNQIDYFCNKFCQSSKLHWFGNHFSLDLPCQRGHFEIKNTLAITVKVKKPLSWKWWCLMIAKMYAWFDMKR